MTETPQQDEETRTGVARENLRNYERFRRSTTDRKIAGVAGGLGRHLNIDPTVLRVLFVVLALFGGAGLVLYGAMWLIVPAEGTEKGIVQTSPSTRNALLIATGVIAALMLLGDSWGGYGFPWPLALVALIVLLVVLNRSGGRAGTPAAGVTDPGQSAAPVWQAAPYQSLPSRADRGPKLFGPTLALVALALGSLGLYDTGYAVPDAAYPALALAVVGLMLLVGAFAGRPGGLILLGIVAALALAIASAADGNWSDERDIDTAPLVAGDVRDTYDLTAGEIRLDLTDVADLEALDGRTLTLHAEAGEIIVVVPPDLDVDVDAVIRFGGEIDVDGYNEGGNDIRVTRHIEGGDAAPQVTLDLDLLVGHLEVIQEEAS